MDTNTAWQTLRDYAEGRIGHTYAGSCPDSIEGPAVRDPECPVCQALDAAQGCLAQIEEPAGAAPAAVAPQGEYPPLPGAAVWSVAGKDGMPTLGKGWMFSPVQQGNATLPLFTAWQMWAYHDLGRQSAPAAPALEVPAAPMAPPLTADEARWAARSADRTRGPSDVTSGTEYAMAGAMALAKKLAAAPRAQTGAPNWWRKRADEIEAQVATTGSSEAMRCYTDMRTLLQSAAAPQAPTAPSPGMTPRDKATQDQIASVMLQHGTPEQQSQALAYASGEAPAAPAVDAASDTALLDAMQRHRIALVPEFEGPWDAEIYNDDAEGRPIASGNTPREALRAALAAQAATKGEHGHG